MNGIHIAILGGLLLLVVIIINGPAMASGVRDALAKLTRALPNGAATVTSTGLDTGRTTTAGHADGNIEYLLTVPDLNTTQLPDTRTMTYTIKYSDNSDLSSSTAYITAAVVQTGAGGAGASGTTFRFRLPSTAGRYVFYTVTGGTSAGDCTGASSTLEALF